MDPGVPQERGLDVKRQHLGFEARQEKAHGSPCGSCIIVPGSLLYTISKKKQKMQNPVLILATAVNCFHAFSLP